MKTLQKLTKTEQAQNKLAYDGLKKIGHNFAINPYNPELYYISEWEEAKACPDNFDGFSVKDLKKFGVYIY